MSFITTGAHTWTVPANVDAIDILAVGGGGGTSSVAAATDPTLSVLAYGGYGARAANLDTGGGNAGGYSLNGGSTVTAGYSSNGPAWDSSGGCNQTSCASGGGGGGGRDGSIYGTTSDGGVNGNTVCDGTANRGGGAADCSNLGDNRGGNGGSGIVVIRYLARVEITTQPVSQTAKAGGGVGRSLTVSGLIAAPITSTAPTLAYRWEHSSDSGTNWSNVVGGTGATTTSYTLPTLETTVLSGYRYRLKITQTSGFASNVKLKEVIKLLPLDGARWLRGYV